MVCGVAETFQPEATEIRAILLKWDLSASQIVAISPWYINLAYHWDIILVIAWMHKGLAKLL